MAYRSLLVYDVRFEVALSMEIIVLKISAGIVLQFIVTLGTVWSGPASV